MALSKKNYIFSLFVILIFTILFNFIFSFSVKANSSGDSQTYIVLDSNSKKSLPNRFRVIDSLNISGSAQFTPSQLTNIKSKLNKPKTFILDLRQESHGFVNDIAISFYNPFKDLNNGFTTSESIAAEILDLSNIPRGKEITIYSKTTRPLLKVFIEFVASEATIVDDNKLEYIRLAVKDGSIPDPRVVDTFVELVKFKPENVHLHFHCDAGEGRTTTFMAMYQMMKNKDKIPLHKILEYQVSIGGIVLTDNKDRKEFLGEFYNYTLENMDSNFITPYSKWIQKPISNYN